MEGEVERLSETEGIDALMKTIFSEHSRTVVYMNLQHAQDYSWSI